MFLGSDCNGFVGNYMQSKYKETALGGLALTAFGLVGWFLPIDTEEVAIGASRWTRQYDYSAEGFLSAAEDAAEFNAAGRALNRRVEMAPTPRAKSAAAKPA